MAKKAVFTLLFMFVFTFFASAQEYPSKPKLVNLPKPQYLEEAKSAKATGKVDVAITIDEQGNVVSAKAISGNELLLESAVSAAKLAKFEPTIVAGKAVKINGVISYNFTLTNFLDTYFEPKNIDELSDVNKNDQHFESLLNLIENYKIGFGFGDKKFHAETPLTFGDFTYFLNKTLNLLDERAKIANKKVNEIGIYKSYNQFNLKNFNDISNLDDKLPYFQSTKNLFEKYEIIFVNQDSKFIGNATLTNNQVIEIWQEIFGNEALPVNFKKISNGDKVFNRGDFVIFLNESLEVLTYKTLP